MVVPLDGVALPEGPVKTSEELVSADIWRHHEIEINSIGRTTVLPEENTMSLLER